MWSGAISMKKYWMKVKAINPKRINILEKGKISGKRNEALLKEIIVDNRRRNLFPESE